MQTTSVVALFAALAAMVGRSAADYQYGSGNRVMWDNNCDLYGNDLYSVRGIPDVCGDICADDSTCSHWSWSNFNGGTCWLKQSTPGTKRTNQWGINCGYVIGRTGGQQQQQPPAGGSSNNGLNAVDSQEMLNRINAYRSQNGLSGLTLDQRLTNSANGQSQDQANQCTMTHDSSDGAGLGDRITRQGYVWSAIAENVAAGQQTVESAMTSWWNSAGHRANILSQNAKNVGFAKAVNNGCGNYQIYWTQDFGKLMGA